MFSAGDGLVSEVLMGETSRIFSRRHLLSCTNSHNRHATVAHDDIDVVDVGGCYQSGGTVG
jgi:hypothetical protein